MSLSKLIDNQVIKIDNHFRGTGQENSWEEIYDIHIDKRTFFKINGKKQKIIIRIPINSDRDITITTNEKKRNRLPKKLEKEIKKAFKIKKKRDKFINDLIKVLSNIKSSLSTLDKAIEALNRISKHFDLKWEKDEVIKFIQRNKILATHIKGKKKSMIKMTDKYIKISSKEI